MRKSAKTGATGQHTAVRGSDCASVTTLVYHGPERFTEQTFNLLLPTESAFQEYCIMHSDWAKCAKLCGVFTLDDLKLRRKALDIEKCDVARSGAPIASTRGGGPIPGWHVHKLNEHAARCSRCRRFGWLEMESGRKHAGEIYQMASTYRMTTDLIAKYVALPTSVNSDVID